MSTVPLSCEPAVDQARTTPAGEVARPVLEVEELRVIFATDRSAVTAVQGISFQLHEGRTLGLVGESGSGKSATARAMMGLLPPGARVTGSVRLAGNELIGLSDRQFRRYRGREIALVFQDPMRSLNPTMRVGEQITEAVRAHVKLARAEARRRAVELLEVVKMPAAEKRFHDYPHQLSGGMRQRVMIAIAIAGNPKVLIADEATTALDVTTQAQIMDLLQDLQRQFLMSLLLISHDVGLAANYTDEIAVMYAGRIVESAPTPVLFEHMQMPYTKALFDAIPRVEQVSHEPLDAIPGRPPNPTALPSGCPFHPRCDRVGERCVEETPPLELVAAAHRVACWHPL